nr:GIY endonuclease [Ophiocordyceps lanpingensis]
MSLYKFKRNHSCTNQVALRGLYNNSLYSKRKNLSMQFVRFYCTDTSLIKELYKDRLAPVKPFTDKIILSVSNILNLAQRAEFFNQASLKNKGKGGIYLIQYKYEPLVYYIGRTNNFERRLKSHLNRKLSDKFHVFANIVGWDNFTISIVEFSEIEYLGIRENYYLQKYLPLLNSTFSSNFSETAIFESLTTRLKSLRFF